MTSFISNLSLNSSISFCGNSILRLASFGASINTSIPTWLKISSLAVLIGFCVKNYKSKNSSFQSIDFGEVCPNYHIFIKNVDSKIKWKIINKKTKQIHWLNLNQVQPLTNCSESTAKTINNLYLQQWTYVEELLKKDLLIDGLLTDTQDNNKPKKIILKPKYCATSKIDPKMQVSSTKWLATMILRGKSFKKYKHENHSRMLIEGIVDDKTRHFLKEAHLSIKAGVQISPLNSCEYEYRSKIIEASKLQVEEMINEIESEEKKKQIKFSVFGNRSWFGQKKHNCATWVISKFRRFLNCNLQPSWWHGIFITNSSSYVHHKDYYTKTDPNYTKI